MAIDKLRVFLSSRGIEQSPTESLAETTARALGISMRELRDRLEEVAQGGVALSRPRPGVIQGNCHVEYWETNTEA